jgi:penicillin G amidase
MRRPALVLTSIFLLTACPDEEGNADATSPNDTGVTDRGGGPPDLGVDAGEEAEAGHPDAEVDGGIPDSGEPPPVEILVPGLSSTVTVDYDEHGVTHISCRTNEDCIAAQGYIHASHRFGQMDLRRRFVRGRLSEIFGLFGGEALLNVDRRSRLFIATREGGRLEERMWQSANAETQAAITAYTRGVNTWIADLRNSKNGAELTADWPIPVGLVVDWDVLDTAACMLGLLQDLTDESAAEITAGARAAVAPPDLYFDVFGFIPASTATILEPPAALRSADPVVRQAIENTRARLSEVQDLLASAKNASPQPRAARGFGSNNWIVSPSETTNQKALLANDPHLGLDSPPIWYVNSLRASEGDLHVAGFAFAGVPGVILGHNQYIAWGATTTFYDMADVYVETLTDNGETMLDGNPVPLNAVDVEIEQLGFGTHRETFYYVPHHGPVVETDEPNDRAISIHWVGHEADTDLNFILAMIRSRNVTEAKAALRNLTATGQNFVVADVQGNIGWFPYSRVPVRPWAQQFPPFLPLPGTGEAEWQGYIPYDELPQSENPAGGYLATANGDLNGALQDGDPLNDAQYLQSFVADGYRQERIVERLEAELGNHSLATMQSIQADVRLLIGEDMTPAIVMLARTSTTLDANGTLVVDALSNWSYECPTGLSGVAPDSAPDPDPQVSADSAGCLAFHALLGRLNRAVFDDEIAAAGLDARAGIDSLVVLLTRPDALLRGSDYWDNVATMGTEAPENIVASVLNATGAYLTTAAGPTVAEWRWGRFHTLTLGSGPAANTDVGPFANDGGYSTVDVAIPSGIYSDVYSHTNGPSMRFACELNVADGVDCTIELPGGQRTFKDSPFYEDLLQLWLVNEPYGLWFDADEIMRESRERVEIKRAP